MTNVPVFITCRNRLTWTKEILAQVSELPGAVPILVDNASTWPPMVKWLNKFRDRERFPRDSPFVCSNLYNEGCYTAWNPNCHPGDNKLAYMRYGVKVGVEPGITLARIACRELGSDYYVVTDDDLDLWNAPSDVFDRLKWGLDKFPEVVKVGLSLAIDDIPDKYPLRDQVLADQKQYWAELATRRPIPIYKANIDTTFAMYRAADIEQIGPNAHGKGLRLDKPYTAIHRPWHQGLEDLADEDWYAIKEASTYTYWTKMYQDYCRARGIRLEKPKEIP